MMPWDRVAGAASEDMMPWDRVAGAAAEDMMPWDRVAGAAAKPAAGWVSWAQVEPPCVNVLNKQTEIACNRPTTA